MDAAIIEGVVVLCAGAAWPSHQRIGAPRLRDIEKLFRRLAWGAGDVWTIRISAVSNVVIPIDRILNVALDKCELGGVGHGVRDGAIGGISAETVVHHLQGAAWIGVVAKEK